MGLVHFFPSAPRSRMRTVGQHLGQAVEAVEVIDHGLAGVGTACVIKECLTFQGRFGKGWKLTANVG